MKLKWVRQDSLRFASLLAAGDAARGNGDVAVLAEKAFGLVGEVITRDTVPGWSARPAPPSTTKMFNITGYVPERGTRPINMSSTVVANSSSAVEALTNESCKSCPPTARSMVVLKSSRCRHGG
jgi:hypothetical protein